MSNSVRLMPDHFSFRDSWPVLALLLVCLGPNNSWPVTDLAHYGITYTLNTQAQYTSRTRMKCLTTGDVLCSCTGCRYALQVRCSAATMVRPASSRPDEDFYMHGLQSISRGVQPCLKKIPSLGPPAIFRMHAMCTWEPNCNSVVTAEHNPGGIMEATLKRLGDVEVIPTPGDSKFVRPQTVMYHLDGALRGFLSSGCLGLLLHVSCSYIHMYFSCRQAAKVVHGVFPLQRGHCSVPHRAEVPAACQAVQASGGCLHC